MKSLCKLDKEGLPIGYFSQADREAYAQLGSQVKNSQIVEIGSWFGRSLSVLLPIALKNGNRITCVDTWGGSMDPVDFTLKWVTTNKGCDPFDVFKANMERLGLWGSFECLRKTSLEASQSFADRSLGMCFIDANHTYECVSEDIAAWFPKVASGGILSGHDYLKSWPGVIRAVNEFCGREGLRMSRKGAVWFVNVK